MSKAFVAWLHPGEVNSAFTESALGLLAWDFLRADRQLDVDDIVDQIQTGKLKPGDVLRGSRQLAGMRGFHAGVNIAGPRNGVVREFLARPEWGDWLLMVDVDMVFQPDALEKLLETADPENAPVVGGLCFGATDGKLWPTLYDLVEGSDPDGPYLSRRSSFDLDTLTPVTATGGAFLMVHRTAYETVLAAGFNRAFPWYQETELAGSPCGEDLTFCLRAGLSGLPVHVNTGVRIGHVKPTLLTTAKYIEQAADVPPVPEGVEVIGD